MAWDQHGCRMLQRKIDEGSHGGGDGFAAHEPAEVLETILKELAGNLAAVMTGKHHMVPARGPQSALA